MVSTTNSKDLPGERTKYLLDESDIPRSWYNIQADLHAPAPPVLHPGTGLDAPIEARGIDEKDRRFGRKNRWRQVGRNRKRRRK